MKELSVRSLQEEGYTEDRKSLRRFEFSYFPFSILGVVSFFYGFYLMATQHKASGLTLALFGVMIIVSVCIHCAMSAPRSIESGNMMERFRRSDSDSGVVEFVYVDPSSKTFCSRVAMGYIRTGIFKIAEQPSRGDSDKPSD